MRRARIVHIIRQLGSLVVTAVTAASTLNAYRPLARSGYLSVFAWLFGMTVTELPLQTLVSQLGGLALTGHRLTRPVRMLAWLVAGISAVGLLNFSRAGHQANVPLNKALDDGLGPSRRTDSAGLWRRPAGAGIAKAPGVLRMLRIYRDYAHDSNISYGEYGGANLLDIWRRPDLDPDGKAPVLFQIPGGAWTTGNKRGQAHPLMSHLAELGWICVAINYRHSPRNTWPDHIVDVKRSLAWVKEHIADYGGDPSFVAVSGGSAGGHLCALAALSAGDTEWQPGFEDADTSVQACVPFYGVMDMTSSPEASRYGGGLVEMLEKSVMKVKESEHPDVFRDASPTFRVGHDAPPFFVLQGGNDTLVPVETAREFVERLRAVSGQPVAYAELPLAQHAFDVLASLRCQATTSAVGDFLDGARAAAASSASARPAEAGVQPEPS